MYVFIDVVTNHDRKKDRSTRPFTKYYVNGDLCFWL